MVCLVLYNGLEEAKLGSIDSVKVVVVDIINCIVDNVEVAETRAQKIMIKKLNEYCIKQPLRLRG